MPYLSLPNQPLEEVRPRIPPPTKLRIDWVAPTPFHLLKRQRERFAKYASSTTQTEAATAAYTACSPCKVVPTRPAARSSSQTSRRPRGIATSHSVFRCSCSG